jgi:Flp pilus assembly pilin Flp
MILQNHIRNWARCARGAVAIEAALIFPVLAVMLIGLVDLGMGLLNYQKAVNAVQVAANVLARGDALLKKDIRDIASAVTVMMRPYSDRSDVALFVGSYEFDTGTPPTATAQWCQKAGGKDWAPPASDIQNSLSAIAADSAGAGILIVGVEMTYKPIFANAFLGDNLSINQVIVVRSRGAGAVQCSNCNTACPA